MPEARRNLVPHSRHRVAIAAWLVFAILTTLWISTAWVAAGWTSGRLSTSLFAGAWLFSWMPTPGLHSDPGGAWCDRISGAFVWGFDMAHPSPGQWGFRLALWPLILFSLGAAIWATFRFRAEVSHVPCTSCGYELAGLPSDCTCPECGKREP